MSDFSDFLDMMPDTVTIYPFIGNSLDGSGKPAYGPGVTYPCRVQIKNHIARDSMGREVTARGTLYVGTTVAPPNTSLLQLGPEFTVTNPPIIDSQPVHDENGPHHVKIEIG